MQRSLGSRLPLFGIWVIVLGSLFYGCTLQRIPQFSSQEAFFAYPALKALRGGTFTYAASRSTPYGDKIWAYHGPVLPHLNLLLFRLFGFSTLVSRLPDFVGGWLAGLLIVLFLNRKGFKYAGFIFAVLWCGNYSTQLLNLGRMEGLALLALTLSFICLDRAVSTSKTSYYLYCGICAGLAVLINPLCILFGVAELLLALILGVRKETLAIVLGASLCTPVLLLLWNFHVRESWQQFRWHSTHLQNHNHEKALLRFLNLVPHIYLGWVIGLAIFTLVIAVTALTVCWKRRNNLDPRDRTIVIVAGLALTGLVSLGIGPMFAYYLICFAVWPMFCAAMLAETHWVRFRVVAFVLAFLWLFSAKETAILQLRAIRYYSRFNKQSLYKAVQATVPPGSIIITSPRFYAIPLNAGYTKFGLTRWFTENENACPRCYMLISQYEMNTDRVARSNLVDRKMLYAGPAFPTAPMEKNPVVILSPEVLPSGAFRTDGRLPE